MAKIFILTVSLDEGVSDLWHFKAESELSVAQYIVNHQTIYAELLDYLPLGKKTEQLTAATLLRLIDESSIDGDSAYGFQWFEMQTKDITKVPNDVSIERHEPINPHFISEEQLESLAKVEWLYRSEETAFQQLFHDAAELSASEQHFIKNMENECRNSRIYNAFRDEKSIFSFIAPIVHQIKQSSKGDIHETAHNVTIQTTIDDKPIQTTIDWMVHKCDYGDDEVELPLMAVEASWKRPDSIREDQVILAKMIVLMNHFPTIQSLYGGYFWGASNFHFCELRRNDTGTFDFHTSKGFSVSHELTEIYSAFKHILCLSI
ncbi:MAG: hypothetical protein RL329_3077 [Bacteroidota bacterium]|jgi:hypothetical protein